MDEVNAVTERIKVGGMSCQQCVAHVRQALEGVEGLAIESVEIGEAVVSVLPGGAPREAAVEAIQAAGYTAS